MKLLVTGAAGFIGSHLAGTLLDQGHSVVGIDSLTDYYDESLKRRNLASIPGGMTLVEADLLDADLDDLLADVDVVLHQAGQPGVRSSWGADFAHYTSANIAATQRLLEASLTAPGLRRFVYASSSSVYGDAETYPTPETLRPAPRSPYGVTKLAGEHLCSLYAANFGLPTVSLRYFTVYGPRQRPDMAFTRFVRAAVDGTPITIYGDGEQRRDFTYVDDIVAANILAATTPDIPLGEVLNVAGGSNVSVNETLAIIEDLHGAPLDVTRTEAVVGDVRRTGGDTTRIQDVLGWKPAVTIEDGLARQYAWAQAEATPASGLGS